MPERPARANAAWEAISVHLRESQSVAAGGKAERGRIRADAAASAALTAKG